MLEIVAAGRGKFEEIGKGQSWKPETSAGAINEEQAAAVEHILRSRDLVTAVRGVAGSGKTTISGWRRVAEPVLNGAGRGHNRRVANSRTAICNRLAQLPKRPASTKRPKGSAKRNEQTNEAGQKDRRATEIN